MIDAARSGGRAESVVDVDDGDAGRAGAQHGEQGGQAPERRPVADAGGPRDDRHLDESAYDTGERAFHAGDDDDHARGAKYVGLRQEAVNSGDPDVGEALDAVLECPRTDRCFLRDSEVACARRANEHRSATSGRGFWVRREIGRPPDLVDLDTRKAARECLRLRGVSARRQKAPAGRFESFRYRQHLADGLARTEDHLLMPLGDRPEVIDRRERQPFEVHAADRTDPNRYSLKISSASAIDSMAKRR